MTNTFVKNEIDDTTLAPKFSIDIAGTIIDNNIGDFIQSVEYESCDGVADVLRIKCLNPEDMLANTKLFMPGNEISLSIGYKEPLTHIGRAIIRRPIIDYPEAGIPTITINGYTKDSLMSNSPDNSKNRRFKDYKWSDAIYTFADKYNLEYDIDETEEEPHNWVQKTSMSDYEMIKSISNLSGYVFWVDGDKDGKWTLHFKNPDNLVAQEKKYTFTYNNGDYTTLLSFSPEMLIQDSKTKIKIAYKNKKNGQYVETEIEEENNESPDIKVQGDPTSEVKGTLTTGSDIKLFLGDYAVETISNKKFKSKKQAKLWAKQWFRRNRENFILGSGKTIGVENFLARQVHTIDNISKPFNGDYFFSVVKHIFDNNGYFCNFNCRKIVPKI